LNLSPGTAVRGVDNPGREGVITNSPPREKPSGTFWQVRWSDGTNDFVHSDEIEPLDNLDLQDPFALVAEGRYGRAADLRRNLTYVHLSGRLANLVYAMGITNTDFYAHQFRPVLTLLDSPVNGLLIADEVGLGKTIEAGLIWTELRARFDMRRLLVVCPAMLREKWRDELRNRFGIDAAMVNAGELLNALRQPRQELGEGKAWIVSYHGARPPRGWRPDSRAGRKKERKGSRLAEFLYQNVEEEPLLDMVVFDEAHYMRNRDSAAWRLGELLQGVSHYQIMLSATPINLRNLDLYQLLRLLDPDQFGSENDFERLIEANRPLVAARDAVLNLESGAKQVTDHLREAASEPLMAESRQLAAILRSPPTDQQLAEKGYRAELADSLERMNLLSHSITRTRKRDVQERRVKREVRRESVDMNEVERGLYDAVTESTREYAISRGINDGFLLATPQRQITSCPAAVIEAWLGDERTRTELESDLDAEFEDDLELGERDTSERPLRDLLSRTLPQTVDLDELRRNDTKFTRLLEVAGEHLQSNPGEKIILFTSFRATARYLAERLAEAGFPSQLLWGGQTDVKQDVIDRFRKSDSLRILVSTEVSAEGVDLQFCRVMINYDLPWNPTRIEQRIGRIDRLGQQAQIVHIWNLYFNDTIDHRIVSRLLDRLRIFEETLGEAEAVVGDEIRRLESALLSAQLTPEDEEREIERAAQALENLRIHREELEKNAAHMMAHGQRVMEKVEAARELARRVTEEDIFVYVKDYLNRHWPGHRFVQEGNDPYTVNVQLPGDLAARLDDFLKSEGLVGETLLSGGQPRKCRFLNRISERARRGEEIVHQFHPLIRFISRDLKVRNEHFYPLVALQVTPSESIGNIEPGTYVFFVRSWAFSGVREEEYLAVAALELDSGDALDEDTADRLVQLGRVEGMDWVGAENLVASDLVQARMETAETILDERYSAALQIKRNENADRAQFQLDSIERYLARRRSTLHETLEKHRSAGRDSLIKATQGQIEKLESRMNMRKERIRDREKVSPERHFVCAGILNVET